jgi:hypothetical protein
VIEFSRFSFSDGAKPTVPRTDVAAEHERRRAVGPALKNVRTAGFLADCVEIQSFDQIEYLVLICGIAQPDTQPFRLWLTHLLIVTDYT